MVSVGSELKLCKLGKLYQQYNYDNHTRSYHCYYRDY